MKKIFLYLYLFCFFGSACSSKKAGSDQRDANTGGEQQNAAAATVNYSNPVLPGDYADPSVIRVGDDYWATATSSEWAPLFPLLHSKNLVDWETVGHVFPDKLPDWANAHFWAPEITYDKGKYYIYYTAGKKGGNLCVGVASATKATGPYTDHGPLVCQDVGSIDGFPIRDEKGELYLIWKEDANSVKKPTPIWGQRLNEQRTALLGEKFELFRNEPGTWEGGLVEGPAIEKRGDYYYMFYAGDACCGRACTYGVGVARAKSIRGPWEKNPANPIMQKNAEWQCPGHGSVVKDKDNRYYFMYHAYSANSSVYPGRQGLLDEIKWGEDNWPYFENRSPSITAKAPHSLNKPDEIDVQDDFTQSQLAPTWQWSVTETPRFTLQKDNGGRLMLQTSPANIGSILGQRTKTANYTATTVLDSRSLPKDAQAGLTAIGDPGNALGVALRNGEIVLWSVKENKANVIDRMAAPQETAIQFRLTTQKGDQMQFAWSTNGQNWNALNKGQAIDGSFLPPWDRGVRVGLTAKGPAGGSVAFDEFTLLHQ